tara:strand:+ start:223 stop:387 length:165 start_codon:yes stop_codon:yes gene_type:complete
MVEEEQELVVAPVVAVAQLMFVLGALLYRTAESLQAAAAAAETEDKVLVELEVA